MPNTAKIRPQKLAKKPLQKWPKTPEILTQKNTSKMTQKMAQKMADFRPKNGPNLAPWKFLVQIQNEKKIQALSNDRVKPWPFALGRATALSVHQIFLIGFSYQIWNFRRIQSMRYGEYKKMMSGLDLPSAMYSKIDTWVRSQDLDMVTPDMLNARYELSRYKANNGLKVSDGAIHIRESGMKKYGANKPLSMWDKIRMGDRYNHDGQSVRDIWPSMEIKRPSAQGPQSEKDIIKWEDILPTE